MRILYPSDPFDSKQPDETYREEYDAAITAGIACSLFSVEDFEAGNFRPKPALQENEKVLYRGWMMNLENFSLLCNAIDAKGAKAVTSVQHYQHCHHLPNWYEACKEHTPETVFLTQDSNFVESLSGLNWPAYFVKDYVKSLTTSRGSVAISPDEVAEVVNQLRNYRGEIEGGICIRRFEDLLVDTEERYFVFNGTAFGRNDSVPELVKNIAAKINCPFFSVDVVSSANGTLRLIELGDGQVSDRKLWPAKKFVKMLGAGSRRVGGDLL
jgi:hypothetical protein